MNSQFHQLPSIRRLVPDAKALIHPDAARLVDLKSGDGVRVVTRTGQAVYRAEVTRTVDPEVVVVPNGWNGEANSNQLTNADDLDPISGFPRLRSLTCRLEKA